MDGVYPAQVAEWAGHSVDVLLRIYVKCVVGQDELAKCRISQSPAIGVPRATSGQARNVGFYMELPSAG